MRFLPLHLSIANHFKEPYLDLITRLYKIPLSSEEISELILRETSLKISARSIQRALKNANQPRRTRKESFSLAIKKGRRIYKKIC